MNIRVIVVRREKDIIQVFPASLVGERGEKKLVVTSDGATREYLKEEVFGAAGLAERRIDELLESMWKEGGDSLILPSPFFCSRKDI